MDLFPLPPLVRGSVVAVAGEAPDPHDVPPGVALFRLAAREPDPVAALLEAAGVAGSRRPLAEFQVDVLALGDDAVVAGLADVLRPLLHPGGTIAARQRLESLGEPEHRAGWLLYRPRARPEGVQFAKLRDDEKRWLHAQIAALAPGSLYAEIGAYRGGSAVIAALANPRVTVVAVDPWADPVPHGGQEQSIHTTMDVFRRHTQYFENVVPVRIDLDRVEEGPARVARVIGRDPANLAIDLLFVDGDHGYRSVLRDLELYAPHVRGTVSGHNYTNAEGVRKAVGVYYGRGLRRRLAAAIPVERWSLSVERALRPRRVAIVAGDATIWYSRGR